MHEHVLVLATEHVQNYGHGHWWHEEARAADAIAKLNSAAARGDRLGGRDNALTGTSTTVRSD